MKTIDFLQARLVETETIIHVVKDEFFDLPDDAFYKQPEPKKWSAAQCFDHLNLTMEIYVPQMVTKVQEKERYRGQNGEFKLSFWGKLAVNAMKPKTDKSIPMKMKTFKKLRPLKNGQSKNQLLEQFLLYQKDIIFVIKGLEYMSLTKPKIISALGPIFKLRIGDALHFMIAHNQRHLLQAKNAISFIN